MVLETLAVTGAYPTASSVGNVMSEPEPTTVFTPPATAPAPVIASASSTVIGVEVKQARQNRRPWTSTLTTTTT